jgi:hypothetical protein
MPKRRRSRKAYATAIGFLLAFVLSTATIILTGLNVGAPRNPLDQRAANEASETEVPERDEHEQPARDEDEATPIVDQ